MEVPGRVVVTERVCQPTEDGVVKRWLRRGLIAAVVVFVAMQAVPYGWRHSNPPVRTDAPWPDQQTASLARASC